VSAACVDLVPRSATFIQPQAVGRSGHLKGLPSVSVTNSDDCEGWLNDVAGRPPSKVRTIYGENLHVICTRGKLELAVLPPVEKPKVTSAKNTGKHDRRKLLRPYPLCSGSITLGANAPRQGMSRVLTGSRQCYSVLVGRTC
jgi:hypothetical protein